jgi:hypothetical protein
MDNCDPKRKCLWGDNEDIAYTPGAACPPNETFSEVLCDCEGYFFCDCSCHSDCGYCELCVGGICVPDPACVYFTEYAWVKQTCSWRFTWASEQPETCVERGCPGTSDGAVSIETANRGMTGTDVMGLSWGGEILDPFICNNNGCPDIEPPRRIRKEVLLAGAPTGDSAWVSFSTCPGSFFSTISITYYEVGVAVGVGATQAEADQAASENLPSAGF